MRSSEAAVTADVYARSLVDSCSWLRPEQRLPEDSHRAYFRDSIADECDVWVHERDDRIVGLLAMRDDEIDRLYIDPEIQGQGVGSALVDHAKALSPSGLRLVTLRGNTGARRFCGRHGIAAFAYGTSPPPENEPDVWYRWRPDPS